MKPYFETKLGKLYCGDCLEFMQTMEDKSVDLVVTSPPYDNLRDYKGYNFNFKDIANKLLYVLDSGGVCIWVVGDATINGSETGTSFKQALYFKEIGFNIHDTMIYEKNSMSMPDVVRYYQMFEYMFVFSKGKPKIINLLKDKRNRWAGSSNFGEKSNRKKDGSLVSGGKLVVGEYGVRGNIWKYNTGKGYTTKDDYAFAHPAMFPEKLSRDQIVSWSNKNDVVLDPMCGAGTTCKMAEATGRRWIGIEISEKYCEIAAKRISAEAKQGKLF